MFHCKPSQFFLNLCAHFFDILYIIAYYVKNITLYFFMEIKIA